MSYWLGYCIVLIVGVGLGLGLFRLGRRRGLVEGLALSLLALFLSFMAVELYFKLFFAQTDAYAFTLAAQNWRERYWQPVNSLGYRDREWSPEEVAGKLKVMVVGDSIAAGQGIERVDDRFSNRLEALLGEEVVVFNVASPGWSTTAEIEALVDYPYRPDILVLAYFINDVEGAAYRQGVNSQTVVNYPPPLMRPLVDNSYALNFLYWRLVRFGQGEGQALYLEWVAQIFADPNVWWVHQQELQAIYEGARSEGIPLIVVVFPNMTTLEQSRRFTGPVLEFFESRGVPTVDVAELVQGEPVTELVASPVDSHPGELVHRRVAERLAPLIRQCQEEGGCEHAVGR